MAQNIRVLVALIAGFCAGLLLPAAGEGPWHAVGTWLDPIGTLWLNALRMTVLPLVFSLLITGIANVNDNASSGRLAARAIGIFVLLLTCSAILAAVVTPTILGVWPVGAQSAAALMVGAGASAGSIAPLPPLRDWLVGLIPTNPFAAAAKGDMLALVVFALFFGFAAASIAAPRREALLEFFRAVVDTLLVIVRWVLRWAPLGVFALAYAVGARGGVAAAGALGYYLLLVCGLGLLTTVLLYPIVRIWGRVSARRFAQAALPAQIVGFSTQSSLASMPAMIEAAVEQLGISPSISAITLPLAVSLFRITSPVVNLSIVLFTAHINGVHVAFAPLAAGVLVAVVTSFGVVGLPSQITFFTTTVPISLALGVPTDILPLLLAIEVVPDLFRTVGNVTADLAAAVLVAR